MRVSQLIDALSKLDQDAEVVASMLDLSEHVTVFTKIVVCSSMVCLDVTKYDQSIELLPSEKRLRELVISKAYQDDK